jgi:metal-sulfur cluster biosynthetic enzyme
VPTARQLSARLVVTILLVAIGVLVILLPYILKRQKIPSLSLTAATTFTDSAVVPAGTPPPDSTAVMAAMNRVVDPEVGIGIADLGLVNALNVDSAGNVSATVILTVPECPYAGQLGAQAVKEVLEVPGVRRASVRLDPTLPWDPTRLSPEAKQQYRKRFGYDPGTGR